MATVVTYAGVELHNVTTREWNEEAVYDPSGTDLLYRRIHMRFQGICHKAYEGGPAGTWGPAYIIGPTASAGTSTPEIFNAVRPLLLLPRQHLQVEINGEAIVDIAAASTTGANTIDVDNGPKPRIATLANIVGDQVFRLDFTIDVAIDANASPLDGSPRGAGTPVLNNRWAVSESVGDNFAVTRTIRGKLRLSRWITNAQDFRSVVVPPLEASFKRDRMDFQVSETGLDCEYTIVDRQVHVAAPWPAVKLDAHYTESSNDGVAFWGDMQVRLEGTIGAGVQLLMIRAMQVIDTRLRIIEAGQTGGLDKLEIVAYSLTEHIGERNAVEANVRVKHTKAPASEDGVVKLYTESFGQATGGVERLLDLSAYPSGQTYNVWTSQAPALFGYLPGTDTPRQAAFLFLLGCYYQDPWHPQLMAGNQLGFSETVGSPNPAPIVSVSPNTGSQHTPVPTKLSPETQEATYSFTRLTTRYFKDPCRIALPIAGNDDDPDADTCAVVTLARPQLRREIHYDYERIGKYPEIVGDEASYEDGSLTGSLLKSWDRVLPPGLTADKTQKIHRIEGYRLYAVNRPAKDGETLRIGVLPPTNLTQEENAIALDTLQTERQLA